MPEINDTIRKMLAGQTGAPQEAPDNDLPSLQAIATNGKLLIENVSKLTQILDGWQ